MSKIIRFDKEARDALKRGVDLAANCVRITLGPSGRNVVIGRYGLTPDITNDGVTVAQNVEAEDETENLGVMAVKEASMLADLNGGDGTTTATVLLQAIVEETFSKLSDDGSLVKNKTNPIQLKRDIDAACKLVVEKLKAKARPVTEKEIYDVAVVSGEYEWIAKIVSDIYEKIGKDGYISIEDGVVKSEYDIYKGIEINAGYHSEYFINDDKRRCVLTEPRILVTNQKLDVYSVVPLIEQILSKGLTNLIMIAPDFSRDLLSRLNTTKNKFPSTNLVAVKLPTYDKDDILIDIATLSEAKFFDKNAYASLDDFAKDLTVENLGKFEQAILGDARSAFIGGNGDTTKRVEVLRKQMEKHNSIFEKNKLEQRIAFLSGGIAVIRIAAESDTERLYYKRKMEDAVNAVQVALRDGVVKGGGLALKELAEEMPLSILTKSLKKPFEQIEENMGEKLVVADNVLDPVGITISSLQAACSLAGMLLTSGATIAIKDPDKSKNHAEPES